MLRRWWTSLTRCAEEGCDRPPERLGYCGRHARPYTPAPDEFWADDEPAEDTQPTESTGPTGPGVPGVPDERTDLPPTALV